MLLAKRYKDLLTYFASDYGPTNLAAIQFDLKEYIDNAEAEVGQHCPRLHNLNRVLREALDAYDMRNPELRTKDRNRDPEVKAIVSVMHMMAFDTGHLHPVANHPLVALVVAYMAQLAGYFSNDPLALTRWGEAKERAEARLAELEAA